MAASDLDSELLIQAVELIRGWESEWGPYNVHSSLDVAPPAAAQWLRDLGTRLRDNYPFFHPRYAGQMLKPPHPLAITGYLAAMLINPNNHALDGGPATGAMEKEALRLLSDAMGFPDDHLGHLTSSGTIANLEALWVAREIEPAGRILVSEQAHYTHARMAALLRVEVEVVPADEHGRMDVDAALDSISRGGVALLVATAGTTGLGAVDPIDDLVGVARRHGVRLHVDAAYGGFFRLLASVPGLLGSETARHLLAIGQADSVVVDPHKHGLQPYGCGAVLFRDPAVGRFYRHDSPYTYFTSDALHLGEISLECSRPGAAAAALWLTMQAFPLTPDGLGRILAACRRAATAIHGAIQRRSRLRTVLEPELDIVCWYPAGDSGEDISTRSRALFARAMGDPVDPLFLSLLRVRSEVLGLKRLSGAGHDVDVLRSVLMKPEHEHVADWLVERMEYFENETRLAL